MPPGDNERLYLDTSVIAGAMAVDWPQSEACQKLLEAVGQGSVLATTSTETARELLTILHSHDEEQAALVVTPALEALLGPLFQVTAADALLASDLLGRFEGLTTRLAVHVAVAMRLDCNAVATLSEPLSQPLPVRLAGPSEWR